jgi:hypothetical protein
MRIDLNVPYSDKDSAKKLGARWDAERKTWYVIDVIDLWPFMKWMPKHLTQPHKTVSVMTQKREPSSGKKPRQVKSKKAYEKAMKRLGEKGLHVIVGPTTPRTDFSMFDPGCSCVPWAWCEHNPERPMLNTALVDHPKLEYSFEAIEPEHLEHIRSIMAA